MAKWKADVNSRAIEVSILIEVKAGRVSIRSSKVGNEIPGIEKMMIRLQRGMAKWLWTRQRSLEPGLGPGVNIENGQMGGC